MLSRSKWLPKYLHSCQYKLWQPQILVRGKKFLYFSMFEKLKMRRNARKAFWLAFEKAAKARGWWPLLLTIFGTLGWLRRCLLFLVFFSKKPTRQIYGLLLRSTLRLCPSNGLPFSIVEKFRVQSRIDATNATKLNFQNSLLFQSDEGKQRESGIL